MKYKTQNGFTIVELLIVVVVIAILAAITIVSYNGITQQAKTSSAQSTASTFQKKAELYLSVAGHYPVDGNALSDPDQPYHLTEGFGYLNATDIENKENLVRVLKCADAASDQAAIDDSNITGLEIHYWDFGENDVADPIKLGTGVCPTDDAGIL